MTPRQILADVCTRTNMYVAGSQQFNVVTAYVEGFDMALGGSLLDGFEGWLWARYKLKGSGVAWPGILVIKVYPDNSIPVEDMSLEQQALLIAELRDRLDEFLAEKENLSQSPTSG